MIITPKKEWNEIDILGGIAAVLSLAFLLFYFYNVGVSASTGFFLNQSDWECHKIEKLK